MLRLRENFISSDDLDAADKILPNYELEELQDVAAAALELENKSV